MELFLSSQNQNNLSMKSASIEHHIRHHPPKIRDEIAFSPPDTPTTIIEPCFGESKKQIRDNVFVTSKKRVREK